MITWHVYDRATAPRDRHIGLLSVQPQDKGGHMISLHVGKWVEDHNVRGGEHCDDSCHELGLNFKSNVGDACATHWCEVADLALPL